MESRHNYRIDLWDLRFSKSPSCDFTWGFFSNWSQGILIDKLRWQTHIPLDRWFLGWQMPFPSTSHGVILMNLSTSSLYTMVWLSRHNLGSAGTGDGMLSFLGSRSSAALCLLMSFVDHLGCKNVLMLVLPEGQKRAWYQESVIHSPPPPTHTVYHVTSCAVSTSFYLSINYHNTDELHDESFSFDSVRLKALQTVYHAIFTSASILQALLISDSGSIRFTHNKCIRAISWNFFHRWKFHSKPKPIIGTKYMIYSKNRTE